MEPAPLVLLLYSAQILVIVSVAALASALCRVPSPAMRLKYWRVVGLLCLSLPVILLPRRFAELSVDAQRAVAYHELVHVARRDWAWIVLEESVRALFWFHPCVWWLVEQVQLAREQVIDELVVAHTASKRAYMNALMIFADSPRPAVLSITFLRR